MSLSRALIALFIPVALHGQTDFYNTDRGRPLVVEDAIVIERRAVELQAAPFRLERVARGVTHWGIAPALAWGLLPRTQIELSLPLAIEDDVARATSLIALAGVEFELLHQLNAETMGLPALAVGAGVHLRAGPLAPRRTVATLRALATRTFAWGRTHLNASYAPGAALAADDPAADEAVRWMGGVAVDHTFPLRSLLIGADVTALESLLDDGAVEWRAGLGLRQQVSPRLAVDGGLFRRLSAGAPGWGLTMGVAYVFAPPGRPDFGRRGGAR
jgi:hypothetical protein